MNSRTLRPFSTLVAAAISCSMVLTATGNASAAVAPPLGTHAAAPVSAAQQALTDRILADIDAARRHGLAPGRSLPVYTAGGLTLELAEVEGAVLLRAETGPEQRGFCHMAAMTAVYTIGAAVFGAAALAGGITVVGIAISAEAAGALSSALAVGSGVSGLVSLYIC
ncbi:hypothetical protein CFP65_1691 [Kitasatospora sp. MMS16-BH015]|uniref:hypothetical protein n=1 Tax=Kitasatospora sp. MMS16-BH015 TaxID=2018025 RepID=UPI000CA15B5F|nr:hypothetical protein [Kitasatospora sp. MMS16-BH015]AUG76573.1 hypothetical protein CFP65_1691 [Kitasatospora sp. MMS16-BH015]